MSLILSATGEPANAPIELDEEELEIVLRCFGMTTRSRKATRNRFSLGAAGRLAPKKPKGDDEAEEVPDPRVALVNSMSAKGIIRMVLDASRLVASKTWRGDMSKASLVIEVTRYGNECYNHTIKSSKEARALAMKAGKA